MELYKDQISMTFTATKQRVMKILMEHVDWSNYYGLTYSSGNIKVQGHFKPDHIRILKSLKFECKIEPSGYVSCVRGKVEFTFT